MNNAKHTLSRGFAALLIVALAMTLAGCSRPPEELVKKGIQSNVNMQALRMNPFTQSAEVQSHSVTKRYSQGDGVVLEFEATVKVKAELLGSSSERTVNLKGRQYFEKSNGEWTTEILL